ncbi:hypothetical protein TIFTF001_031209 [Ficus carica]|uniref:Uncharacterized protein n=1 Tax=Ficus carica TaxID=3494 RepID=A0AA88E0J2_FICCA|nr:hypothetical protein TIFTF001_031209 [Ficus carica]
MVHFKFRLLITSFYVTSTSGLLFLRFIALIFLFQFFYTHYVRKADPFPQRFRQASRIDDSISDHFNLISLSPFKATFPFPL